MGVCQSQPFVVAAGSRGKGTDSLQRSGPQELVVKSSKARSSSTTTASNGGGDAGAITHKPKLTLVTSSSGPHESAAASSDGVVDAPLTGRTAAETPLSTFAASPNNLSADSSASDVEVSAAAVPVTQPMPEEEDELDEDEHEEIQNDTNSRGGAGLSLVHFFQSLRHTEELDPVIPEEVDPDAPSDEEDERLFQKQQELERSNPLIRSAANGGRRKGSGSMMSSSPPRPQDCIKLKHSRITHPHSIVNRQADDLVPRSMMTIMNDATKDPTSAMTAAAQDSTTSVNPSTLSEFRKLKVQVKLAARAERKKQRIAKLEDRYQDVRGYNNLWQNFEEIRGRVESSTNADDSDGNGDLTLKRSDSFDLHDTGSWFFDFSSFDDEDTVSGLFDLNDDDDNHSQQSGLSLHSTTSMESQRRYFEEKRQSRLRRKRSKSDTNLFLMNQLIKTKEKEQLPPSASSTTEDGQNHYPPSSSSPTIKFKPQHRDVSMATPPSILRSERGKPNDVATTSVPATGHESDHPIVVITPSKNRTRGPVAPTVNAFEIATGQPEYHVYKRPGEKPVTQDDDTPKAKSKRKQRLNADPIEVDMDNDYQVARRRRAPSFGSDVNASIMTNKDDSIQIIKSERGVAESLGIHLPPSPVKRDFEYSSFAIDIVSNDSPEVKVMRMTPLENDTCNRKEKVVTGNAARCLEETFARSEPSQIDGNTKERDVRDCKYKEPPSPTIDNMSTEEFLRYSDNHALVNIKRGPGHSIFRESNSSRSSRSDGKENDTDDVAEDVTTQIDVLEWLRHL